MDKDFKTLDQAILPVEEVLDGRHGSAYATINGRRYLLFMLKNFEGKIEKTNQEIQRLGTVRVGNLSTGAKGTWSATLYYNTDIFRATVLEYLKTGKETYFDIQITNENPNGTTGRHTTIYKGCRLNGAIMSKLDVNSTVLEESVEGTFEDMDMPEVFNILEGME